MEPTLFLSDALFYLLIVNFVALLAFAARQPYWQAIWRQYKARRVARFSLFILGIYFFIALLDSIHFYTNIAGSESIQSLLDKILTPLMQSDQKTYLAPFHSWAHPLGTDKIGRDVLYGSMKSIRTAVMIGTLTTLIMMPFAIVLGMLAGYLRGWVDDIIQYVYTTLSSIPDVLLIMAAALVLHIFIETHPSIFTHLQQSADVRLVMLCLILGITSWTGLCRLLRGETLKIREQDYVQASRVLGVSTFGILFRHVLPNLLHLVIIAMAMDFSGLVLAEAVLTYIGIGVDPSLMSWGNMISQARFELTRDPVVWWPLFSAFILMFPLVVSANLVADGLRDACDPRIR